MIYIIVHHETLYRAKSLFSGKLFDISTKKNNILIQNNNGELNNLIIIAKCNEIKTK